MPALASLATPPDADLELLPLTGAEAAPTTTSAPATSVDSRDGYVAARPTVWQGRLLAGSLQTIGSKQKGLRPRAGFRSGRGPAVSPHSCFRWKHRRPCWRSEALLLRQEGAVRRQCWCSSREGSGGQRLFGARSTAIIVRTTQMKAAVMEDTVPIRNDVPTYEKQSATGPSHSSAARPSRESRSRSRRPRTARNSTGTAPALLGDSGERQRHRASLDRLHDEQTTSLVRSRTSRRLRSPNGTSSQPGRSGPKPSLKNSSRSQTKAGPRVTPSKLFTQIGGRPVAARANFIAESTASARCWQRTQLRDPSGNAWR